MITKVLHISYTMCTCGLPDTYNTVTTQIKESTAPCRVTYLIFHCRDGTIFDTTRKRRYYMIQYCYCFNIVVSNNIKEAVILACHIISLKVLQPYIT